MSAGQVPPLEEDFEVLTFSPALSRSSNRSASSMTLSTPGGSSSGSGSHATFSSRGNISVFRCAAVYALLCSGRKVLSVPKLQEAESKTRPVSTVYIRLDGYVAAALGRSAMPPTKVPMSQASWEVRSGVCDRVLKCLGVLAQHA